MTYSTYHKQLTYITKISIGLIITALVVVLTLLSPSFQLPYSFDWLLILFCTGFFVLIFPFTYLIYLKMDELQKKLHDHASVFSLMLIVSVAGIVGVLQANNIIPLFNQVWFFVSGIAVWGLSLSFSDQLYK
ncbi:MAG: hypothetical protein ACC657_11140 [Thiohalomonadales bacterium]